jgi:hypothetical protein
MEDQYELEGGEPPELPVVIGGEYTHNIPVKLQAAITLPDFLRRL